MRLPVERIKQGVLHPDQAVRNAAVCCFSESLHADPGIMPQAIQAIETFGWRSAFSNVSFLEDLTQTEESVAWLIRELGRIERPDDDDQADYAMRLSMLLSDADPRLLMSRSHDIFALARLEPDAREAIRERIALWEADPEQCWREVQTFCEREKSSEYVPDATLDAMYRRLEVVARFPEQFAERVLRVLDEEIEEVEDNPLTWMEGFAVWLAGEMRLAESPPLLVDKLHEDVDWLNDECVRAFVKLAGRPWGEPRAGDAALETLCADYFEGHWHYRVAAAAVLARVHTDRSEQLCLDLLGREQDETVKAQLCEALLLGCSSAGIEAARQLLLERTLTPELLDLRRHLLTACALMDETFPELDAWRQDILKDESYRRRMYAQDFPVVDTYSKFLEERAAKDAREGERKRAAVPARSTGSRSAPAASMGLPASLLLRTRAGRNDPCPCGSGKKYKKCCLRV